MNGGFYNYFVPFTFLFSMCAYFFTLFGYKTEMTNTGLGVFYLFNFMHVVSFVFLFLFFFLCCLYFLKNNGHLFLVNFLLLFSHLSIFFLYVLTTGGTMAILAANGDHNMHSVLSFYDLQILTPRTEKIYKIPHYAALACLYFFLFYIFYLRKYYLSLFPLRRPLP